MRYDKRIRFYVDNGSRYDPTTSSKVANVVLVAVEHANVTDMGTTRSQQLLGSYVQGAKVVRLASQLPTASWSFLTIGEDATHYVMQTAREVLKGNTLIVQEVGK